MPSLGVPEQLHAAFMARFEAWYTGANSHEYHSGADDGDVADPEPVEDHLQSQERPEPEAAGSFETRVKVERGILAGNEAVGETDRPYYSPHQGRSGGGGATAASMLVKEEDDLAQHLPRPSSPEPVIVLDDDDM
ncbi:hypothetical protein HK101_003860 [Irineochytrium annulatum]|nr:hypothetical protein HK101_003860 [Irineochytrium annulatum]